MTKLDVRAKKIRDAFLDMIADGELVIEYDADQTSTGSMIDCSSVRITTDPRHLEELMDTLGIQRNAADESLEDAIRRAIEEPPVMNKRMAEKLAGGEAVDVSECARTPEGDYILEKFIDDVDYCDKEREAWIWSIGKNIQTGQIIASTTGRFYQNPLYECLWLR